MMQSVVNVQPVLFRPPYGERDPKVLAAVDARKMKSVLWNIDSEDWADPVAKSIANRVIKEARKLNHGIILMHDIHERTIDAVPLIIETLQSEGFRFLSWDGKTFVDDGPRITETPKTDERPPLYHESWAVIIGIDDYPKWPRLHYAVNDARSMSEMLTKNFSFKPDHVITLFNEQATREKILSALGDTMANPKNVQRDDRVFVFFAGHGATRKLPSGRDLGYIIPFDADSENFQGQSISMSNFQDISEGIPAKHVFFLMDSCYSGLALTRGAGSANYLKEISQRTARQMLTAGGGNEEVSDSGPNGHSIFSWTVLQGLEGRADLNSDGYITATELASYIVPSVSSLAHQTPAYGNLPGSEGGEFIFELHPETEFLSEVSSQLDKEAIQLNSEIERARRDIATKTARNEQLRQQLAAIQAQQTKGSLSSTMKAPDTARAHLNKGDLLYKENRVQEALDEFLAAAKLDPKSALAANNAGFMYTRLGNLDQAIQWTEKAVAIDPKRAIAYANLGDAYFQLNRLDDARRVYQIYLELAPNGPYAADARERVAAH
jgi:tetratricopeptide (TPR) repeat protein